MIYSALKIALSFTLTTPCSELECHQKGQKLLNNFQSVVLQNMLMFDIFDRDLILMNCIFFKPIAYVKAHIQCKQINAVI